MADLTDMKQTLLSVLGKSHVLLNDSENLRGLTMDPRLWNLQCSNSLQKIVWRKKIKICLSKINSQSEPIQPTKNMFSILDDSDDEKI